ncbi:MAG TPA: HAMP domain-containing sensor histidine kinase, partial [Solirubrobacteraceae bacterium]
MVAPAGAGAAAWVIAGDVQNNQQRSLVGAGERVLARPRSLSPAWLAAAVARLRRLGVPAHLESAHDNQPGGATTVSSREKPATSSDARHAAPRRRTDRTSLAATPNFKPADAPTAANAKRYQQINIHDGDLVATLLIPRGNPAVPWIAALATGLAALLAAIIAASMAVRRWIARPLAQLASGAEQIAAGDLEIDRVLSPVREIAVVGEAQHGMARSLAEAVRAARAAEHERHFLITAIAHDLRTPLFTLRGSLEALELGIGDQGALPRAQQKAAHLDRLVSDLFTFSRLEYTPEPHHQRPFDIRETAQHAVDSIATPPAAVVRTIAVELPDEPVILHSDETAVARILTNLLDNAIRNAHERVHLRLARVHDGVELEISDDGPGFAAHTLPHIFD